MMESLLADAVDFSQIQRVLVVKLQHLGDVLLSTPVFSVLKQHYPHLEIDVLVYADTAVMLRHNPDISKIFCIDRNWKSSLRNQLKRETQLYQSLKQRDYQLLICLTDRMRGAWLARLLRPRYSVALKYSFKRGRFWANSFSHTYSRARLRHIVEAQLDALRRLGLHPGQEQRRLKMCIPPPQAETVAKRLDEYQLKPGEFVVIHPCSRWMYKGWNVAGFAELIARLHQRGIPCVLVSGPDASELAYVQAILSKQPHGVVDLSGQLNLSELAALIGHARCFIGLDSVATHIAAAVGTASVVLFGPSNDRFWGPWQVPHRLVTSDLSCRPCDMEGCANSKVSDCLQAITPDQVMAAYLQLTEETSA